MKSKFIICLFICMFLGLSGLMILRKIRCGDGICQNWESKRANCEQDCAISESITDQQLSIFKENAGALSWNKQGLVAFSRLGNDGYFDLWVSDEYGENEQCLSCDHLDLPNRHIGQPVWHPSGDYIVFQAQKKNSPKLVDNKASPGAGVLNDLWIMSNDGDKVWLLYEVSDEVSKDSAGVLHAHFSNDGRKLFWSERIGASDKSSFGEWRLKIADFGFPDGSPKLSNIQTFNPGDTGVFFESHSFSPDDKYVLFTGDQDGPLEIYEMESATGEVKRLTKHAKNVWDEHAHYSPDGKKIVYMSSQDLVFKVQPFELQTEFWIMDRDGANQQRLTYFHQPGHDHYLDEEFAVAADSDWSQDGKSIMGLVLTNHPDSDQRGSGKLFKIKVE